MSDIILTIEQAVMSLLEKVLHLDGVGFIEDNRDTADAVGKLFLGAAEVCNEVYEGTDPDSEGGALLSTLELRELYGECDDIPGLLAAIQASIANKAEGV